MARKKAKKNSSNPSDEGNYEVDYGDMDLQAYNSVEQEDIPEVQVMPTKQPGRFRRAANYVKGSRPKKYTYKQLNDLYGGTLEPIGSGAKRALGFTRDVYFDSIRHIFVDEWGRPVKELTKQFGRNADTRAEAEENILNAKGEAKRQAIATKSAMKQQNIKTKAARKEERRQELKAQGKTGFLARMGVGGKTKQELQEESMRLKNLRKSKGKGIHWRSYSRLDAVQGRKLIKDFSGGKVHYFNTRADVDEQIKKIRAKTKPGKNGRKPSLTENQAEAQIRQLNKAWTLWSKQREFKVRGKGIGRKIREGTYGEKGRKKWLGRARGVTDYGSRNLTRTFQGVGQLGEAISKGASQSIGPIQIFQMAWGRLSTTLKYLVMFVILGAVLFIPWGIFYYTGWAIAAAFMFLISLVFWLMVNILNGVARIAVTVVNGVVTIIMNLVIFLVQGILGFITESGTKIVPEPTWASTFEGNPWEAITQSQYAQYAVTKDNSYWYQGHLLLEGTLINYNEIATIPTLMVAETPMWQDWMNTTLIVRLIQLLGLDSFAETFKEYTTKGISSAFESFIEFAPPWMVVIVGLLPAILLGIGVYEYYRRSKRKIESGQTGM
jgi:hypothetical protein